MQKLLLFSFVIISFISCSDFSSVNVTDEEIDAAFDEHEDIIIIEEKGLKFIEANDFPLFSDCQIGMVSPNQNAFFGPNTFELTLQQYSLRASTTDEKDKGVKLSEKGQFLYFITNRNGIEEKYDLNFEYELKTGNTSFFIIPSRSYGMTIKNDSSYLAFEYNVTRDSTTYQKIEGPVVLLTSPREVYPDGSGDRVLFDFFLIGTEISETGNKIKVSVDNREFILSKWCPYYLEGLKTGTHTVSVQLIDKDGNEIDGRFTSSKQRITVQGLNLSIE